MRVPGQARWQAWVWSAAPLSLVFFVSLTAIAQESSPPNIPPDQLVRLTIQNEIGNNQPSIRHMFRSRKQTPKGSQTHIYIETEQAMAGMLVAVNGHPLSPDQKQAELKHLSWLESNPDALRKKHAREKEDSDRTTRIMRALPDAFRYQYAGTEDGTAAIGRPGVKLVRLKFTPNPAYSPPTRAEQVLTGMQGTLLIDPELHRLACIDGKLFQGVNFGWGIFGHLDKGSVFHVQQADVGDNSWEITEMKLNITGKILLFKNLSMISDEVFSDFQRVPDNTTFAKGVEMLKAEEERFAAENHSWSAQE
jgi:hypothetical protein